MVSVCTRRIKSDRNKIYTGGETCLSHYWGFVQLLIKNWEINKRKKNIRIRVEVPF